MFLNPVQAAVIEGGSDFESATPLSVPGSYQGPKIANEKAQYFYFNLNPGTEIKIAANFAKEDSNFDVNAGVTLYDADQQELRYDWGGDGETVQISWLPGTDGADKKYYLKIYNDSAFDLAVESYTLKTELTDRYDAASQTDAGGNFDTALAMKPGDYQSYFSGGTMSDVLGDDFDDFYKLDVQKGQRLNISATPPAGISLKLSLYDSQRTLLDEAEAANDGQIVNLQYPAQTDGSMFLAVSCGQFCGDKRVDYKLAVNMTSAGDVVPPGGGTGGGVVPPGDGDVVPPGGGTSGDIIPPGGEIGGGTVPDMYDGGGDTILPPYGRDGFGMPGGAGIPAALIIGNLVALGVILFFSLIFYIYFAVCLQKIAKRTNTAPAWLAWIPIANAFLMLKIAQKPLWWFFLLLVPAVNIVVGIIVWMKIAEFTGKESWVGILILVPVIGIAIPAYLAFSGDSQKKTDGGEPEEKTGPEFIGGSKEADKPTVGYKHPCKYCEQMVSPDAAVCPFCGKEGPLGPDRCPKCHDPIDKKWKACAHCGLNLRIVCPFCGKVTFFGKYCEDCGKKLTVACPVCQFEQPPLGDKCIKCGQPLKGPVQGNNSKQ